MAVSQDSRLDWLFCLHQEVLIFKIVMLNYLLALFLKQRLCSIATLIILHSGTRIWHFCPYLNMSRKPHWMQCKRDTLFGVFASGLPVGSWTGAGKPKDIIFQINNLRTSFWGLFCGSVFCLPQMILLQFSSYKVYYCLQQSILDVAFWIGILGAVARYENTNDQTNQHLTD